jgi:2-hydroxychromene-2-carboxylate isomerase
VLANQVALVGAEAGWGEAYSRATYRRWFDEGSPAGEEPNLSASIREAGQSPETVMAQATSERIIKRLAHATDEAMALGVFGSPTFVVGKEVFWGDDRLDDAILWARENSASS